MALFDALYVYSFRNFPRVGNSRSPMSRRYTSAHKSVNPFGAGVPVRPTTRLKYGRTIRSAFHRDVFGHLNDDSSSITSMSKKCPENRCPYFDTSHGMFSRLMMYRSASALRAFSLFLAIPTTLLIVSDRKCAHTSSSSLHVDCATRSGATIST